MPDKIVSRVGNAALECLMDRCGIRNLLEQSIKHETPDVWETMKVEIGRAALGPVMGLTGEEIEAAYKQTEPISDGHYSSKGWTVK